MKILLLGANGQVGHELLRALAPLGEIVAATRNGRLNDGSLCARADLADTESLRSAIDTANAEVVLNAAAYTSVDRAEVEPDLAERVNHRAVAEIGTCAAKHGSRVIHYSTDYVFDGTASRPYREDGNTSPLGVYGRTKLAGEDALRASGVEHLILRTAWIYAARGHNFLRTMLRLGAERAELQVVADQIGAPTPASWIADATAVALTKWTAMAVNASVPPLGIFHLTASGQCSWYDFACAILSGAKRRGLIDRVPRIVPVATADYPVCARRPAYSVLDSAKIENTFGLQLADWRDGLRVVLDEATGRSIPAQLAP